MFCVSCSGLLLGRELLGWFDDLEGRREYARPELKERRLARLLASPAGFFRGVPALFYQLLRQHPQGAKWLEGTPRWIVGDVHLENIGVIAIGDGKLVFDWNDLDEAICAPVALDVARGAASAAISAESLGLGTSAVVRAATQFVESYNSRIEPAVPRPVAALLERAKKRTHEQLLEERCAIVDGERRFALGKRYLGLLHEDHEVVEGLFKDYVADHPLPWLDKKLHLDDAAFRVQGTGSLGVQRYIWLVRSGKNGPRMLVEAKEIRTSAVVVGGVEHRPTGGPDASETVEKAGAVDTDDVVTSPSKMHDAGEAGRVVAAMSSLLHEAQVGVRALRGPDGRSYLVRLHAPGEDKFAIQDVGNEAELLALAAFIGSQLSHAHTRHGAGRERVDVDAVLEVALDLASTLTRAHLALVERAQRGDR